MTIALFILEAAALGAFFASNLVGLVLVASLSGLILFLIVLGSARLLAPRTGESRKVLVPSVTLAMSPLCLLFLKHLSVLVFLRDIRSFLFPVAMAGAILLVSLLFLAGRTAVRSQEPVSPRTWVKLFLISFAVYAFLASGLVFPQHPLTGDEPHYLLITKSLLADGDINLYNNYANKDYRWFYPGELESHAKPGPKGPRYSYSRHLPAVPVMLIPFYVLGEKTGNLPMFIFLVRLPMCLLTALVGAAFFLLALDLTGSRRAALVSWFVVSFTGPILFFSGLIYPEVPAALITVLVFRHLILHGDKRPFVILLSGLGLALLPWLGAKYGVLSVLLFLMAVWPLLKRPIANRGRILCLFVFPLVSAVLFFLFLRSCYGHFNPVAIYSGADMTESSAPVRPGKSTDLAQFASAALSLFVEQKAGILVYAPLYFLIGAGFFLLWKKNRKTAGLLLTVLSAYGILCALTFFLGGYCPPGRPLLPLSWVLAVFVSVALAAPAGRMASLIKGALIGLSFIAAGFSLPVPQLLYNFNISHKLAPVGSESQFLGAASSLFFDLRKWTPSLDASNTMALWPLAAWILVFILVTALFFRPQKKQPRPGPVWGEKARAAIVLVSSIIFLAGVFFRVHLDARTAYRTETYELFFQDENNYGLEQGGFWTKGTSPTTVVLKSPVRVSALTVSLSSAAPGEVEVRVDRFRRVARHNPKEAAHLDLVFAAPRGFPWKGGYLYVITVREHRAFVPFQLDRRVLDNRELGIFVALDTLKPASLSGP
jgi:hypothetical protein